MNTASRPRVHNLLAILLATGAAMVFPVATIPIGLQAGSVLISEKSGSAFL